MQSKSVQRRVYGKRRANAPRAVFEASPARERPSNKLHHVDPVQNIQTKLAEVKIEDEPTVDETPESPSEDGLERESPDHQSESSQSSIADSSEIEAAGLETEPASVTQKMDRMVEVRIYNKVPKPSPDIIANGDEPNRDSPATSKSTSTPLESTEPSSEPTLELPAAQETADSEQEAPKPVEKKASSEKEASEYVLPILREALSPIAAQSIQKFDSWASRSANMFDVAKLAEGSYGEVYKLHLREEVCRPIVSKSKFAKLKSYGDGVFKVVPLRAKSGPGSKKFTSIDEIVAEVKMLKYLDPIPGFARFREIHVVQGRFPESFQNAWDHYKKTKDDCMNPNPSNKRSYPDTQLWAIIEMDDAGCELEKFAWSSIFQIYDIFWGVAMALARAEEYAMFEHRDLHLGNVCIRSTREDGCMNPPTEQDIARQSSSSGFGFSALETTIIDYSLSRADLLLSDDPNGLTEIASSDLDKKQLFDAIGQDEDEIMQRNTYRYMRATLYSGNPVETEKLPDIPGIWAEYAPRTNLVWLLFLLQSLFKNRKPEPQPQAQRKALAPCSPNMKASKPQSEDSAKDSTKEHRPKALQAGVSRLKKTLEERLTAVLGLLDLETGHEDMCCAADLVAYAMDSQWLGEEDFF
ncbi:hypothetical protein N7541_006366 [Penicillium brevicompactum]|uniref:non-specific serine/threonine protein kinase n=1 Tax=Penicillium brevicompactum TaxID=5074 RepID=A0A9W9UQQ5_PENBR|nr:hypothetical protein N7541_006366 [Penicillium brevicompactum]